MLNEKLEEAMSKTATNNMGRPMNFDLSIATADTKGSLARAREDGYQSQTYEMNYNYQE